MQQVGCIISGGMRFPVFSPAGNFGNIGKAEEICSNGISSTATGLSTMQIGYGFPVWLPFPCHTSGSTTPAPTPSPVSTWKPKPPVSSSGGFPNSGIFLRSTPTNHTSHPNPSRSTQIASLAPTIRIRLWIANKRPRKTSVNSKPVWLPEKAKGGLEKQQIPILVHLTPIHFQIGSDSRKGPNRG